MKKFFLLSLMTFAAICVMAQYPTRVYLCGPGTPSGWSTEHNPMYTNVDADNNPTGTYEWVGNLNDGEMKLLYGSSWEPGYASATDGEALTVGQHEVIDRPTNADPDNKWAAAAGRFKLVLDVTNMTLTVSDGTGLDDKNGDAQTFVAPKPANVYPIGDGTTYGWNTGSTEPIAMVEGTDGVYDGVVFLKSGEFKLLHQADWGAQYGPVENGEVINGAGTYSLCKPSDDNKWRISETITDLTAYHMIADVNAGTLVLRDTVVIIPPCTTLYMCGDAVGGWSFDDNAIELNSEDSVFYYEGQLYDGEFKFFEKKDFGSQAWGAIASGTPVTASGEFDLVKLTEDNKFYMTAGYYKLTANLKTGKMSVVYSVTALENTSAMKAEKFIENGQVVIIRNGEKYSVLGQKL